MIIHQNEICTSLLFIESTCEILIKLDELILESSTDKKMLQIDGQTDPQATK